MKNTSTGDVSITLSSDEKVEVKCSESQSLLADDSSLLQKVKPKKNSNSSVSSLNYSKTDNLTKSVTDKQPKVAVEDTKCEKTNDNIDSYPKAAGDGSFADRSDATKVPPSRCCGIQ